MSDGVRIHGLAEFRAKMAELPRTLQRKVLRGLMRDSMKLVRETARTEAPVLQTQPRNPDGTPRRLPGTLRRAISVRTSKAEDKAGNVGVFVNVRPLKGNVYRGRGANRVLVRKSQRGADNPRDPYYWRWLEFGTRMRRSVRGKRVKIDRKATFYPATTGANRGRVQAYGFLKTAAARLDDAVKRFTAGLSDWVAKANSSGRVD
jgi:HK97 gp10 family phage protein